MSAIQCLKLNVSDLDSFPHRRLTVESLTLIVFRFGLTV